MVENIKQKYSNTNLRSSSATPVNALGTSADSAELRINLSVVNAAQKVTNLKTVQLQQRSTSVSTAVVANTSLAATTVR